MQVITYSLREGQEQSDHYYQEIIAFTDEVIAEGEHRFVALIGAFRSFVKETNRESPRGYPEYLYELLVLGILWRVHIRAALGLGRIPRQVLIGLAWLRERDSRLKPSVDALRGVLSGLFLSSNTRGSGDAPSPTLEHFQRLLGWLLATGIFVEEVKRLSHWQDFLIGQSPEQVADVLKATLGFADWFEARSASVLGRYTPNVERFLAEIHPQYRWREDALFCGRKRVEYHLGMVGTEILNRAFRDAFLHTRRKTVLVPPCMRFQPESKCQARSTAFGAQCAHCTPECRVHQVTKLGEKHGFAVFILPDELSVFSPEATESVDHGDLGIVGVSCVLTNAPGGWEAKALGVAAQGVPLDYCGCRYHWHKEGIPTDVNFRQLLRVLGVKE